MAQDDGDPLGRAVAAARLVWATPLVVDSPDQVLVGRWMMVHDGLREVRDFLTLAGRPVASPEVDDEHDVPDSRSSRSRQQEAAQRGYLRVPVPEPDLAVAADQASSRSRQGLARPEPKVAEDTEDTPICRSVAARLSQIKQ
jgi:hypothetical protein